jgi:hypothetical protein
MLLHIAEKRPEFDWGWRWLGFDAAKVDEVALAAFESGDPISANVSILPLKPRGRFHDELRTLALPVRPIAGGCGLNTCR